jgi:hypothetical protein
LTSLFDSELILIEENGNCGRENVDKWLAIGFGGTISSKLVSRRFFFEDEEMTMKLFELIQPSSNKDIPEWILRTCGSIFTHLTLNYKDEKKRGNSI